MSKLALRVIVLGVVIALLGVGSFAIAGGSSKNFRGSPLNGFQENPDVSTPANGRFEATLSNDGKRLAYTLRYDRIDGGGVTQAHIHFAKRTVNGGIVLWLCSNLPSPPTPPGTQACPTPSGTVTGVLDEGDVAGVAAQGIPAGQAGFDEIIDAMRAGRAYANVHSTQSPSGEIRAQINDRGNRGKDDHGDDDDD
jgi:hypothetical protein